MGAWGTEPWDNDAAADWFTSFFRGIDVDSRISAALEDENADVTRAVAFLLSVLGRPYTWPGEPSMLGDHLDRAISRMESLAVDKDYLAQYTDPEHLLDSIANLVSDLQTRRNEIC